MASALNVIPDSMELFLSSIEVRMKNESEESLGAGATNSLRARALGIESDV
jgi:hypothetical protein